MSLPHHTSALITCDPNTALTLYIDLNYLAYRYENYTITATQNSVNRFITVVKYKCKLTLMHRHATTTDVCKVTKYSLHSLYFSRSDMKNIDFI